jgi:hypothetical protein
MDFLWVRWFSHNTWHVGGWKAKCLHRIGLLDKDDPEAYGFLDLNDIIRTVHLIPAFALGDRSQLETLLGLSSAQRSLDWFFFYVNLYVRTPSCPQSLIFSNLSFVDHDMFMRYLGGGIGHRSTRDASSTSNVPSAEDSKPEDNIPSDGQVQFGPVQPEIN